MGGPVKADQPIVAAAGVARLDDKCRLGPCLEREQRLCIAAFQAGGVSATHPQGANAIGQIVGPAGAGFGEQAVQAQTLRLVADGFEPLGPGSRRTGLHRPRGRLPHGDPFGVKPDHLRLAEVALSLRYDAAPLALSAPRWPPRMPHANRLPRP